MFPGPLPFLVVADLDMAEAETGNLVSWALAPNTVPMREGRKFLMVPILGEWYE